MLRLLQLLLLLAMLVVQLACGSDDKKEIGEICNGHNECASGLCTTPLVDGGTGDGGPPPKRCAEPSI
jgi:hypothetical protein